MKRYQITVAGLIVLMSLNVASLGYAQEKDDHGDKSKSSSADAGGGSSRPTSEKQKVSEKFDELLKIIGEQDKGATIVYYLKKDGENEASPITLDSVKLKELKNHLEGIKKYNEKLLKCGEAVSDDKVSIKLLETLNELVTYISEQKAVGKFDTKGTLTDKELNTFVVRIQKSLEEKAAKFKDGSKEFEKSDKELTQQLVAMAKLLQGGAWDKKIVDQGKIDKDSVREVIKVAKEDSKMCKLDEGEKAAEKPKAEQAEQPKGGRLDETTAPPIASAPPTDPSLGTPGTPSVGAGGNAGNGFTPPNAVPNVDPSQGNFQLNKERELLDALQRAADDRDRERQLQDEFLRQQLDQNNLNNDQTIRALQGALNSAQRPNNSRGNSDRSEQGPQISPSLSMPPSQQQPFQQMPMQPMPQPQPLPLGALMNNGPAQQPIIPYTPSRFNDDIPRPAATQPDPTTNALLQTLQQQNQMFQQMMTNRYPYMGNGVPNVAGPFGQQLQSFGGGYGPYRLGLARRGGGPRLMPSRFGGVARGGVQGQMGINSGARGTLPSRLR